MLQLSQVVDKGAMLTVIQLNTVQFYRLVKLSHEALVSLFCI